jgi:hypothetical protein
VPRRRRALAALAFASFLLAPVSPQAAPGNCAPKGGLRGWPIGTSVPPPSFAPGDVIGFEAMAVLQSYLPPGLWEQRDRFFYDGMRLEIGACFADYAPPAFFQEATTATAGAAKLLENGGLSGYVAGLPFPPNTIEVGDPDAGAKWAWNFAHRYQAAGFRGPFRISDMIGSRGHAEPFLGEIFVARLSFRADRAGHGYAAKGAKGRHWVAGGNLSAPANARDYAWRQFRHVDHLTQPERTDDVHAYLPDWRRVRRITGTGVEGLYMPSFSVGVKATSSAIGGGSSGGADGGSDGDGAAATTITTRRSGFEGLEIRPLLYEYRLLGSQDVLTPINANQPSYPVEENRDFGPFGLSFASDRWDLRRAIVLEARARGAGELNQVEVITFYMDEETLQPLYYFSQRFLMNLDSVRVPVDAGMFVGRFSEDRESYPGWPDDKKREVRVIDSVGAAFANLSENAGWRRESWSLVSTPPSSKTLRRQLSVNELSKRH